MAIKYNNRKITLSESAQKIATSYTLPGMILTFNYAESGVLDPRPLLLLLHENNDKDLLEGLNLNYINPSKINFLFQRIDRLKIYTMVENLVGMKNDYSRVQLTSKFRPLDDDGSSFYKEVVLTEKSFIGAYRKYKLSKLTQLRVLNVNNDYLSADKIIVGRKRKFIDINYDEGTQKPIEDIYQDSAGRWRDKKTKIYVKVPK